MSAELLSALVLFSFVSSVTPGPNNLMLLASGANFGLRRSVPHMLGISIGHSVMVVLIGLGLYQIFAALPAAHLALKVLSVGYLLFLAWKIAHAAAPGDAEASGKPFTFLQAAAFQWVNPKAWFMAVTAVTAYTLPESGWAGVLVVAIVFAMTNLPSITLWAWFGTQLRRLLTNPTRLRAFNWTMATLLVASLYPVLAL